MAQFAAAVTSRTFNQLAHMPPVRENPQLEHLEHPHGAQVGVPSEAARYNKSQFVSAAGRESPVLFAEAARPVEDTGLDRHDSTGHWQYPLTPEPEPVHLLGPASPTNGPADPLSLLTQMQTPELFQEEQDDQTAFLQSTMPLLSFPGNADLNSFLP